MQQVSFAEAHPPVDEQWIVSLAGILGYPPGCSIGKLVGAAHDERLKGITGVENAVGNPGLLRNSSTIAITARSAVAVNLEGQLDILLRDPDESFLYQGKLVTVEVLGNESIGDAHGELVILETQSNRFLKPGLEIVFAYLDLKLAQSGFPYLTGGFG